MKTGTFLRLSLLVPFLVWGICVLCFIILSALEPAASELMGSNIILGLIFWMVMFYVFGIIGWFLPYGLLSLILMIWSFKSRAQVLMKVFALSPLAMALLIVIFVSITSIGSGSGDSFSYGTTGNFENVFGSNLWFALLALIWGYICVGIGYGLYKLLQRLGWIKVEAATESVSLPHAPS